MSGMISSLPEEDVTKRIFSCIPGMVKKIEEEVSAYSSEDERKIFYEQYGVKLDQNNKVVKIKHDSAYLKKYLEEQLKDYPNISSYNKFNFYIDEYRDPQEDIKVFVKTSKKAKTTSDENEQYILGEGSFGKAKKVRTSEGDQDNLQYVVMKKIDKRKLASQEPIHNEIIALKAMNQYRGYIEIGEFVYIFSQFVPGSYLSRSNLSKEEKLSKKGLLEIAIQLVNQLIFLHSRGIFHFDIKHNNALYNINGQGQLTAQLIDFGSVRMLLKDALPDMDKISP